ncbi:hypothetical protein [Paludisphaera sp.]|uniref:hypothetical protein n=1 Tax=Paludisphaera sp. TaxID=2017432 RepID=UPI00301CE70B
MILKLTIRQYLILVMNMAIFSFAAAMIARAGGSMYQFALSWLFIAFPIAYAMLIRIFDKPSLDRDNLIEFAVVSVIFIFFAWWLWLYNVFFDDAARKAARLVNAFLVITLPIEAVAAFIIWLRQRRDRMS